MFEKKQDTRHNMKPELELWACVPHEPVSGHVNAGCQHTGKVQCTPGASRGVIESWCLRKSKVGRCSRCWTTTEYFKYVNFVIFCLFMHILLYVLLFSFFSTYIYNIIIYIYIHVLFLKILDRSAVL